MPAQRKNLVADKGATFTQPFRWVGQDLTGYVGEFSLYNVGRETAIFEKVCATDSTGLILVHVTDEETDTWAAGKYAYRLELAVPNGDVIRLVFGTFEVRSGVDV